MAGYSGLDLQIAVYNALIGDATLQTALGASGGDKKVYDVVPQNSAFPYISIGDETGIDWSSKTFNGMEVTMTLHVWTKGRGKRDNKALIGHLHRILHNASLSLSSNSLVMLRFEFDSVFADEGAGITGQAQTSDLITYHGVTRFRAITTESGV